MSRDRLEGWPGQYRRMLRWRERVAAAARGGDGNELYDFVYAFFQSCHHLRDWLVATGGASQAEMNALVASSTELQLCRDICNATKHLQVDRPSVDPAPMIAREYDPWTKQPTELHLYSDRRRPIAELIDDCVKGWDGFLSSKGLANQL